MFRHRPAPWSLCPNSPPKFARSAAHRPSGSFQVVSAPASSSTRTASSLPLVAAKKSGVQPWLSMAFTSAPAFIMSRTIATSPSSADAWSGVRPLLSEMPRSGLASRSRMASAGQPHLDGHHNAFSLIALSEVYEASPTPPGQLIALTPPLGFFFAARSFTLISGFAFAGFFCLAMVLVIWVLFYYGLAKTTLTIIHASRLQHRICDRKDWRLTPRHILSLAAEYQIFTSIKNHQPRFRRFKHKAELLVHPIAIAWTHCVA